MEKEKEVISLGTMNVKGDVYITDPCYNTDTWCMGLVEMKKGEYNCFAHLFDCGIWGERIGILEIILNNEIGTRLRTDNLGLNIGVDSGQAGFFNKDYYENYHHSNFIDENSEDEKWYKRVCDITLSDDNCGVIDDEGVVSESGYGDGGYDVYGYYNDNDELVGLRLEFIWEDEEENDEDYE